jgi:hypothetical protein
MDAIRGREDPIGRHISAGRRHFALLSLTLLTVAVLARDAGVSPGGLAPPFAPACSDVDDCEHSEHHGRIQRRSDRGVLLGLQIL